MGDTKDRRARIALVKVIETQAAEIKRLKRRIREINKTHTMALYRAGRGVE